MNSNNKPSLQVQAEDAVSALKKLATLGNNHSLLSSHPAPGERANRLQLQIEGKSLSREVVLGSRPPDAR